MFANSFFFRSPRIVRGSARATLATLSLMALATLAACGGDGGSTAGPPTATVSSISVAATKYAAPALVTINGTGLDSTLSVTSAGCANMTLLTAAPTESSSTTAYYSCTVDGAITSTVVAASNGTTVGTSPSFTVPQPIVTMTVNNGQGVNGNITFTLAADKAPATVFNFLTYVNSGFYNGTIFHRVVSGFIAQAGGYAGPVTDLSTATLKATNAAIPVESTGLSNVQWSVAMANTGQAGANTTSQFFINLVNNPQLDGSYAVFGTISAGTDVVGDIVAAPASCVDNRTITGTIDCLPIPNVTIVTATQTQ